MAEGFFRIETEDRVRIGKYNKHRVNIYQGFPIDLSRDNRELIDPTDNTRILRDGPLVQVEPLYVMKRCGIKEDRVIVEKNPKIIGSRSVFGAQGSVNPDCISDCGGAGNRAVFNEKFRDFAPDNDGAINPLYDVGNDSTLATLNPNQVGQTNVSSSTDTDKSAHAGISFQILKGSGDTSIVFAWNDDGYNLQVLKDKRSRMIAAAELQSQISGGGNFQRAFDGERWYYEIQHNFNTLEYMAQVQGLVQHTGVASKVIYKKNSIIIAQYWDKTEMSQYDRLAHLKLPERLDVVFFK
tara:strand:+ start:903 stop:1790 length:888 start_codon:yes stop_codon:yes gene_type:complete